MASRSASATPLGLLETLNAATPWASGTGFVSPLWRSQVVDDRGEVRRVVLKGAPTAAALASLRLHERECLFYRDWTVPVDACPTPRCLAASPTMLVLEEVEGASTPRIADGVSVDLAAQTLKAVAAVHSASRRRAAADSDGCRVWDELTGGAAAAEAFLREASRANLERVRSELGPDQWLPDELVDSAGTPEADRVCLVHGDLWSNNLLVADDHDGRGSRLRAVLDWQFAQWGAPTDDVAWFLVSSLDPALRRAHTGALLSAYADAAAAAAAPDGTMPSSSLPALHAAYRASFPRACLQLVASADAFFTDSLPEPDRARLRARFAAALADLHVLRG